MVRVNTRISKIANDWLDNRSNESGIPKSTLILLAVENYMKEIDVLRGMSDMSELVEKIERLEREVKRNDPE